MLFETLLLAALRGLRAECPRPECSLSSRISWSTCRAPPVEHESETIGAAATCFLSARRPSRVVVGEGPGHER
jgi:hypothetical protein